MSCIYRLVSLSFDFGRLQTKGACLSSLLGLVQVTMQWLLFSLVCVSLHRQLYRHPLAFPERWLTPFLPPTLHMIQLRPLSDLPPDQPQIHLLSTLSISSLSVQTHTSLEGLPGLCGRHSCSPVRLRPFFPSSTAPEA
jgi:hypothetical protein